MRPRDHVILGTAASAALYSLSDYIAIQNLIYFWLATILIDIDHYLDYIYNNKFTDYSFKRMMRYHGLLYNRRFDPAFINLSIFHSVESMGALGAVTLYTGSTALLYIWWGFLFHIALDTIKLVYDGKPSIRSNTAVGYILRVKRLNKQGLDTKGLYTRAANEVRGNCGS
ncbi:MAG: hypothetical protein IME98_03475 [Proteobacteria bacterium]|nr:hypothetical protein [Pseudomonadota bacterium]